MSPIVTILSMSFSLFLLMDSIGNVPLFIAILKNFAAKKQRKIILRELVIALGIILLFALIGEVFLSFLKIEQYTISIAGGIILFLIALKMIFPQPHEPTERMEKEKEPFIVPLATPFVAGPAVLASVMLYSKQENAFVTITSILISWLLTTAILLASSSLQKILGRRGLIACERLMGLILTLLAVQMFLHGIATYVEIACVTPA